jgi:hypothetical protein
MLEAAELVSYGLKSCEKVTPVVGSAISGWPPPVVDPPLGDELHALTTTARVAAAVSHRYGLRFIDLSPP